MSNRPTQRVRWRRCLARRLGTRGGAAVELALCLPLLLLLLVGVAEFGRALYTQHVLIKGVRDSVRYLARVADPTAAPYQTIATNLALRGSTSASEPLLLPNAGGGNTPPEGANIVFLIAETTDPTAFYSPTQIVIGTLSYPFSSPLMSAFGFTGTFTMTLSHAERYIGA
jgi:hypothetical protein